MRLTAERIWYAAQAGALYLLMMHLAGCSESSTTPNVPPAVEAQRGSASRPVANFSDDELKEEWTEVALRGRELYEKRKALSQAIDQAVTDWEKALQDRSNRAGLISAAEHLTGQKRQRVEVIQQIQLLTDRLVELVREEVKRGLMVETEVPGLSTASSDVAAELAIAKRDYETLSSALYEMRASAGDGIPSAGLSQADRFHIEQQLKQSEAYAGAARNELKNLPADATLSRSLTERELREHEETSAYGRSRLSR